MLEIRCILAPKGGAKMKKKIILGLVLAAVWFSVGYADTFNITYSLVEGGSRMELDPKFLFKGLQLTTTVTPAIKYEIIQNITRPLVNPTDNSSIGNKFVVRGLRGTNRYGDLRIISSDPGMPVRSGERVYISTTGNSDSFTLVYGISDISDLAAGVYTGQISFTLRPIDSSVANVTIYVDVAVRIEAKDAIPVVEITTPARPGLIYLNSRRDDSKVCDVLVRIGGGLKGDFSIVQILGQPIEAVGENKRLDYEAVNFQTAQVSKGMGAPLTPLSNVQQIIYSSGPSGVADTEFVVSYGLGDLSNQRAGRYRATIKYYLQQAGKPTKALETLALEIEVGKIFDLTVKTASDTGKIEFNNLKYGDAKVYEVNLEIKSNIAKRYQVTQRVLHELVNKEGAIMPEENFTLKTENLETKGVLKFLSKMPVKKGDTVLFVSDDEGSSDSLKVIYELLVPREAKLGDYSTSLSYSISEI